MRNPSENRRLGSFLCVALALCLCTSGCSTTMYRMASRAGAGARAPLRSIASAASAVRAPETPAQESPAPDPVPAANRVMVYDGWLTLVVDNITETLQRIRQTAESAGGYVQAMRAQSIRIKVPAADFAGTMSSIETFGELTHKAVEGQDVTDKMRDLRIRLKNAEEVRLWLVALLDRAQKVEDAIKIERELERITETIELLKGRLQALEHRVAFSTITVELNSPLPQRVVKQDVPFRWVRELAGEMTRSEDDYWRHTDGLGVAFRLPKGFAKYYQAHRLTRAISADGLVLKVQRHRNVQGGNALFWTTLARRSLAGGCAVRIGEERDIVLRDKVHAKLMLGSRSVPGSEPLGYLLVVATTSRHAFTYEAWGPESKLTAALPALEASVRSMRVLHALVSALR